MFDNIDFNDRERDGDALILDLFHQWQAAMKDANNSPESHTYGDVEEKNFEEKMAPVLEIEHRLARIGASGPAGLAIKGFLAAFNDRGPNDEVHGFLLGILEDAVRFVPELGPLAEKILAASTNDEDRAPAPLDIAALRKRVAAIVAEFDLPLPDGDAGIFEAARRLHEIQGRFLVCHATSISPARSRRWRSTRIATPSKTPYSIICNRTPSRGRSPLRP